MGVDETSSLGDGWSFLVEGLHEEEVTFYDDFEPIPLTEDWLMKFGFSKMTDTTPFNYRIHKSKMFCYIRYGNFTTDNGKTMLAGFNGLFIGNKFVRCIVHVHDLQNLFYSLTKQELELCQ